MPKMYVVTMQRWGDSETHHYLLGLFDSIPLAREKAIEEEEYRGGKYEALIQEVGVNFLPKTDDAYYKFNWDNIAVREEDN